jgi:hypothetical protein
MSAIHSVGPFGLTWHRLAESLLSAIDRSAIGPVDARAFAEWLAKVESHPQYSLEPGETAFAVIAVESGYLRWMHGPPHHADLRALPLNARVRLAMLAAAHEAGISVMQPDDD